MTLVPDEATDVPVVVARETVHTGLAPQSARAVWQQYVDYFRGGGGHYNARSWLNKLFFGEIKILEKREVAIRGLL